jgi:hypothetical protein
MRSRSLTFCVMMRTAQAWAGVESLYIRQGIWRRAISFRSRGDLLAMAAQTRRSRRRPPPGGTARLLPHLTYLVHTPAG